MAAVVQASPSPAPETRLEGLVLGLVLKRATGEDLRLSANGVARAWRAAAASERKQRPAPDSKHLSFPTWFIENAWRESVTGQQRWGITRYAAVHGRIDLLEWMLPALDPHCLHLAALEVARAAPSNELLWLWAYYKKSPLRCACFYNPRTAPSWMAPHTEYLSHAHYPFPNAPALALAAAEGGNLDLFQNVLCVPNGWRPGENDAHLCAEAAGRGHLDVLRWLRAHGCPWDERTCVRAAIAGNLEVLRWARVKGCPCGPEVCVAAARWCQLPALKMLREPSREVPPCPWDPRACWVAAKAWHERSMRSVDLLTWIRARMPESQI